MRISDWSSDVCSSDLAAGEMLAAKGFDFDLTFTSVQTRAIRTLNIALEKMGRLWLPHEKDWRLNERHYGGLTGFNKAETAAPNRDATVVRHRIGAGTKVVIREDLEGRCTTIKTKQ